MADQASHQTGREWARRYPPFTLVLLAAVLAGFVLPSSLNVTQPNPSQTLEFAPVPPDDEGHAPAQGNVASVGLGSGAGGVLGAGGAADVPGPPPPPPDGQGATPASKRCVGDPPRQTEDPLSPPCVAHFEGDNGGATAPGVTGDEVRVLFYFDGRSEGTAFATSRGAEDYPPERTLYDLGKPPEGNEYVHVRLLRTYQRYFNERFQTYGRFVRLYVYYGSVDRSPEAVRADAAEMISLVRPFAIVNFAASNAAVFSEEMARADAVAFLGTDRNSGAGQEAAAQRARPGLFWSYWPTLEQRAALFTSYVCRKVVGHPVSHSGNGDHGQARRLGLLRTDDRARPDLIRLAELYREGIEACGGEIVEERTFGAWGCSVCGDRELRSGLDNMVAFEQAGITTIIWGGGTNGGQVNAAQARGYRPEWLVAGEGRAEDTVNVQQYPADVWQHARVVTSFPYVADFDGRPCVRAAREADPSTPATDLRLFGCDLYPSLLQLFTGVQVAGPRLASTSMDRGFHAIPAVASSDRRVPACFYDPADYSCVKDGASAWWDPAGGTDSAGCWRMMEGGQRYLAGTWPSGDVDAQRRPDDPCNPLGRSLT